ncbi:MAG: DUF5060 domain-containing protein [Saccharofermentanales bacterium]
MNFILNNMRKILSGMLVLVFVFSSMISAGMVYSANTDIFPNAATVEQWKINEISFNAAKTYTNPYKDIYADVKFTNGSTSITMPMFWDGGNVWKVRFAPPKTGIWTWEVVNANAAARADTGITSAAAGGGSSPQGRSFNCIKPASTEKRKLFTHGFVNVAKNPANPSANNTYMAYADGTPFFWSSYIPINVEYKNDFWHNDMPGANPNKGQFQMSIDKAASGKYNVVKFLFLDWFTPFSNPDKTDPWYPFYQPVFGGEDPTRFNSLSQYAVDMMKKEVDSRMDYMASKDMIIELESCYADKIFTDRNKDGVCEDYLQAYKDWYRYLYARYGAYPMTLSLGYETPWYYDGKSTNGVSDQNIRKEKYNELYNYADTFVKKNRPLTGLFIYGGPISGSFNGGEMDNDYVMNLVDGNALSVVQPMQYVAFSNVKDPVLANNRTRDFYTVYNTYYLRIEANRRSNPNYIVKPVIGDETTWEGAVNPEFVLNPATDKVGLVMMSLNMWKTAMMTAGTSYGTYEQKLPWYNVIYDYPGQVVGAKILDLFNNPALPWWKMHPVLNEEYNDLAKWTNPNIEAQPWQKPDIRTDYKRDFPDLNQKNSNFLIYFPAYPKAAFDKVKEGDLYNILQQPGVIYNAKWYNPTKGGYTAATRIKTTKNATYGTSLQLPSKPDNGDWILWLALDASSVKPYSDGSGSGASGNMSLTSATNSTGNSSTSILSTFSDTSGISSGGNSSLTSSSLTSAPTSTSKSADDSSADPSNKPGTGVIIMIIAAVLILIGGGATYILLFAKNKIKTK